MKKLILLYYIRHYPPKTDEKMTNSSDVCNIIFTERCWIGDYCWSWQSTRYLTLKTSTALLSPMRLKYLGQVSSSASPISQCYFSHVSRLSLGGWTVISITHTYKESLSVFPAHSLSPAQHFVRGPREILTQQRSLSSYPSTATLALSLSSVWLVSLPSGFILPLVAHWWMASPVTTQILHITKPIRNSK